MKNITDAILAVTLKDLIADSLINRKFYNEIPPHVEYYLTEKRKISLTCRFEERRMQIYQKLSWQSSKSRLPEQSPFVQS
jgi:DNA-binding HxlR family transcriptional regulator